MARRIRISVLACVALLIALDSCGGDDGKSKASQCDQLENSLCDRTTDCAIMGGVTTATNRDVFNHRCHTALTSDLMCSVPADGSGDFELCNADIQEIPCDVVIQFLNQGQVVAPTSNCGDFFGL